MCMDIYIYKISIAIGQTCTFVNFRIGSNLTNQDLDEMVEEADKDGDGQINYEGTSIQSFLSLLTNA